MSEPRSTGVLEDIAHGTAASAVTFVVAQQWLFHLASSVVIACLSAAAVHFFKKWVLDRKK